MQLILEIVNVSWVMIVRLVIGVKNSVRANRSPLSTLNGRSLGWLMEVFSLHLEMFLKSMCYIALG